MTVKIMSHYDHQHHSFSRKLFCGQTNETVNFIMETMETSCSGLKSRGTIQLVISTQFKSLHF